MAKTYQIRAKSGGNLSPELHDQLAAVLGLTTLERVQVYRDAQGAAQFEAEGFVDKPTDGLSVGDQIAAVKE